MAHVCAPSAVHDLVMLGLIHRDREGEALLSRWLERSHPDVITLEFSYYGRDFRLQHGDILRSRVHATVGRLVEEGVPVNDRALAALLSYIELPAEYVIAGRYAADHHVPLFLVDVDRFSSSRLDEMEGLIEKENLVHFLSREVCRDERYEKTLARLFFEKGVRAFDYTEEMGVRDTHMRDEIGSLMRAHGPARFIHLCGWQHLCDPCHLYDELNPTKVFIYDKTLCI